MRTSGSPNTDLKMVQYFVSDAGNYSYLCNPYQRNIEVAKTHKKSVYRICLLRRTFAIGVNTSASGKCDECLLPVVIMAIPGITVVRLPILALRGVLNGASKASDTSSGNRH